MISLLFNSFTRTVVFFTLLLLLPNSLGFSKSQRNYLFNKVTNFRAKANELQIVQRSGLTSCAIACIIDIYCIGYNVRSEPDYCICELLASPITDVLFNGTWNLYEFGDINRNLSSLLDGIKVYQVSSQMSLIPVQNIFFNEVSLFRSIQVERYDYLSSTLTFYQSGLYWFHLAAGIPAKTPVSFFIVGLNYTIGIFTSNSAYLDMPISTDGLSWVDSGKTLHVSTNYSLYSSSQYGETTWSWFRLDNIMKHLVAFYVVNTNVTGTLPSNVKMPYDKVLVNEGNGWNSTTNQFVAPISGYYFLSFGIGSPRGISVCLKLIVNSIITLTQCVYETAIRNGTETSRASTMVSLNAGDTVANYLLTGFTFYSVTSGQSGGHIYMQGFLYYPSNNIKAAWSVASSLASFYGPKDPLVFNVIYVNEGNTWNAASNTATILQAGIYLIDITTYLCGMNGNRQENVQMMLNNNTLFQLKLDTTGWNDCISRSRSFLLQLSVGDSLRVRIPTTGSFYVSNSNVHHAFTGILLNSIFLV